MKFTAAAVLSAAAGVSATYGSYAAGNSTVAPTGTSGGVAYVTKVVTALTTYCPEATEIVHGSKTYTVTSATTLTITDCPCTVVQPVIPTSAVVCHTCGYSNNTASATYSHVAPAPGTSAPANSGKPAPTTPPTVPTAGAGKAAALTGAGLAGIVGLAAFLL